jgi:prefoldin beta subunit
MATTAPSPSPKQQEMIGQLQSIQTQIQAAQQSSQQCIQQHHENDMVLKELEEAGEDAKIYKMMGGALIPQDYLEATTNVKKRLEFIKKEEEKLEKKIAELQQKGADIAGKLQSGSTS